MIIVAVVGAAVGVGVGAPSSEEDLPKHERGIFAFVAPEVTIGPDGRAQVQMPLFGALPERPSLIFPPATSYRDAIQAYYEARQSNLELPSGAVIGSPLPQGKVVRHQQDGSLVLDPAAPLGFDLETGRVIEPTFSLPGSLTPPELDALFREAREKGWVLPRGATMVVAPLPRCQIASMQGPACDEPGADRRRVVVD